MNKKQFIHQLLECKETHGLTQSSKRATKKRVASEEHDSGDEKPGPLSK